MMWTSHHPKALKTKIWVLLYLGQHCTSICGMRTHRAHHARPPCTHSARLRAAPPDTRTRAHAHVSEQMCMRVRTHGPAAQVIARARAGSCERTPREHVRAHGNIYANTQPTRRRLRTCTRIALVVSRNALDQRALEAQLGL